MNLNKIFFPHDDKVKHIKSLDGLRGLAVIIVLLAHSHHVNNEDNIFSYFGRFGVYLFYILSAYLLDKQIIGHLRSEVKVSNYWLNYGLRRFLRIYPLYFLALIGYYLLNRNLIGNFVLSINQIIESLLMLQGPGVFWSIPVEFKYYIISPFIMLFFHFILKWKIKPILIFIISLILFSFIVEISPVELNWYSTLKSITALILGSLLAISENQNFVFNNHEIRKLELITIFGLFIINPFTLEKFYINGEIIHLVSVFIMPLFLSVLFLSARFGLLKNIMEFKAIRYLGNISFSIYLSHMIVAYGLRKYGFSEPINFLLYPIITILISSFSYLIIEYPFSKIKYSRRINSKMVLDN